MAALRRLVMSSRSDITSVLTDKAPAPAGHYVQATVCGGNIYVSGQLAVRPDGTHAPELSFEDQVRQALDNLLAVVLAAGSSPARLLKVTAYIVGIENWPRFNAVYAETLGDIKPARTVVPVPELHYGYRVEIDAIAAIDPR
jgi:reactive intermediate/imine deaminase